MKQLLRDASESAEHEPARFTLSHVQMRGSDGRVLGTDGRQLIAQSGFSFPWDKALLVPASRLLRCSSLQTISSTFVGTWSDRVAVRTGPWTLWFKINRTGRFPEVDSLIEKANSTTTTLKLVESDAKYLLKSIRHLPGADAFNTPITVDLNGTVVLRTVSSGQNTPTDMVLTSSFKEGADVRFAVNRQYLMRAIQMGFREFMIGGTECPVVARDGRRTLVWANLGKGSVLTPVEDAIRVESPRPQHSSGHDRARCGEIRRLTACRTRALRKGRERAKLETIIDTLRGVERQAAERAAEMEQLLNSSPKEDQPNGPSSPANCEMRPQNEV